MGAKTWMLGYVEDGGADKFASNPQLDRQASIELAHKLFPSEKLEPIEDGSLAYTCPRGNKIYVGCFPGLNIVAAYELGIDYPSKLPKSFLEVANRRTVYHHAMHSVVDWFAYAKWDNGELVRSLSLSPDDGVIENIGQKLPFEEPYWNGDRPACDPEGDGDDYPLPFHPLELGEAALLEFFGYVLEGPVDVSKVEPIEIPLVGFKRKKTWWRFW
jgi:hypothetical protein